MPPPAPPLLLKKLRKFADFFSGSKRVLEIGSGWGEFLILMREAGVAAEGAEPDFERAAYCRSRGLAIQGLTGSACLRRSAKGRYNGIFMSNIIEHLSVEEAKRTLALAWAKLPAGGKIAIATANPRSLAMLTEFWHDLQHTRPYPLPVLRSMLEDLGFSVLKAEADEDTRPHSLWRWMLRKFRSLLIGPYFEASEIYILAKKPSKV